MMIAVVFTIKLLLIVRTCLFIARKKEVNQKTVSIVLFTPYWLFFNHVSMGIMFCLATLILGYYWSGICSVQRLSIKRYHYKQIDFLAILFAFMLLNFNCITAGMPHGGDEDFHIANIWEIGSYVLLVFKNISVSIFDYKVLLLICLTFVLCLCLIVLTKKAYAYALLFGSFFLGFGIIGNSAILNIPSLGYSITRYPFLTKWITLFLMPNYGQFIHQEANYRILPFLSAIFLSFLVYLKSNRLQRVTRIAFSLLIVTIPTILYYSTMLYLELPAILLMVIALFDIEYLLTGSFTDIKKRVSWYSLILLGFIKETTLPFLLLFLLFRVIIRKDSLLKLKLESIFEELKILFALLLPYIIFFWIRYKFEVYRSYNIAWENLFSFGTYLAFGKILTTHMLPIVILFALGLIILFKERKFLYLCFLGSLTIIYFIFLGLDKPPFTIAPSLIYFGRHNLFFVPAFIVGAVTFLNSEFIGKSVRWVTIFMFLIFNLAMSPVSLQGHKYWHNNIQSRYIGEHFFRYAEAMSWLKENHNKSRILFTGMTVKWWDPGFYLAKVGWKKDKNEIVIKPIPIDKYSLPVEKKKNLMNFVEFAKNKNINVIFYLDIGGQDVVDIFYQNGFKGVKTFRTIGSDDKIVIFSSM
ncbi:hypothetical protein ACFL96_15190 [Thermoproteota archaeon]